jgi:hypothetical protein
MIFSIIIIKEAWASIEKNEKKCGHMKVHKKCEDTSIVKQKKPCSYVKDGERIIAME